MINIAFTGTQKGMTDEQLDVVGKLMMELADEGDFDTIVHHGDCIGADDQIHTFAYYAGFRIEIHPQSVNESKRAFGHKRLRAASTVIHTAKPPIARNHDMVDASDVLVATPKGPEQTYSGTWATIRYARKKRTAHYIVWPDGRVDYYDG